ncbi:MAG: ribulose-phosphate 3-epimerase [Christensenellales bacterium]
MTDRNPLLIAPSLLAADLLHLGQDVSRLLAAGADLLHLDIMDGHFVPNLSFGPDLVRALRSGFPGAVLDVHLMMTTPESYIEAFAAAGADALTVHVELAGEVGAILRAIRARGLAPGLSLKPATPPQALQQYLDLVDRVLIMSVEPGFGGQKMIPETLQKAVWLRQAGYRGILSVDGGVTADNARQCIQAGADQLVMGTALLKAPDPRGVIAALRELVRP